MKNKCDYSRNRIHCTQPVTRTYSRSDWPNDPTGGVARTCDQHKMGDGKEGRPDYGWREVTQST